MKLLTQRDEANALLMASMMLIITEDHWVQLVGSVDERNAEVNPSDLDATRWCALGAVESFNAPLVIQTIAIRKLKAATVKLFDMKRITNVNDFKGHAAVMQMYEYAIEN